MKEALPSSYEEDCSHFTKRPADEIFKIQPDLVIASKIDDWWSRNKVSEQYHILVRNCATIVCDALDVGARDPDGFAVLQALSLKGSITPMDIRYFCANMRKITFQNFDIFNGLLSVLLCIGFVTVVFIKLFYGSNKWYQLISTCLRIILIITCLLRYLEVLLALCSTSTLVLIFGIVISLIYMFINHVYNSFIIIDLLSSDNDTAVSWINSTENRTFIVFWTVLFSTNFFNSSPFKIISFYLTFYGLQFATQSFFYKNYDIIILLFFGILNGKKCLEYISQPDLTRSIGTQTWCEDTGITILYLRNS